MEEASIAECPELTPFLYEGHVDFVFGEQDFTCARVLMLQCSGAPNAVNDAAKMLKREDPLAAVRQQVLRPLHPAPASPSAALPCTSGGP